MTGGTLDVLEADVQQGDVAIGDDDVGEVGHIPQGAQIQTGDAGDDTEGDDHQAEQVDDGDPGAAAGDAVGADLAEGQEAHQAGEGEQAEAQGHQEGDSTVQSGAWGQLGAGSQELGQLVQLEPGVRGVGEPDTTHDDHKTGEGADDDGVQEHAQGLDAALVTGMLGVGSSGGHGDGTLTGFIGHQTALDTLNQGDAESAAKDGFRTEGLGEDGVEEPGDAGDVQDDEHQDGEDIDHGHDGHDDVGDLGHLFGAAEGHEGHQDDEDGKGDPVDGSACGDLTAGEDGGHGDYGGDGVEALCRQAEEGVEDIEQGQGYTYPCSALQQTAAVEGETADVLIVLFLLEDLGQGGFGEGGGHAEEGGEPHPEQGAGAADADGAGDAQDVARPYPHRSGEQEGGQGGDARLGLLGLEDVEAVLEFPHLDEAQLAGEEDAGADQKDDGQAEVPQDGDVSVPVKVGRKIPKQVGDHLEFITDRIDRLK